MLGAIRKTVIGGASLGLLAVGLATGPAPVHAATGDACVIAASPADVFNVEFGEDGAGHPGNPPQASNGSWVNSKGASVARYGLYYPATDPVPNHAVPRAEGLTTPGATSSIPMTPVQTGDHFKFAQGGNCVNNGARFSTGGNAIGYCGRSVGLGVGTVNGVTAIIRWESVGTQLIMLDPSARGSVNAQANPPGDPKGSCLSGTAITFLVDGALTDVRPAP
ncbi:MAG: hypothetical protein QOK43_3126 [Acidimicrobiaceae bacterium]|jgi:hypothetical protein|nr:hypothetical protein [Acidimicrobiaceae bacterium]MDQ1444680.1 hypothetical protein [Acidimicrobiaceae bacterium]